jgi:hypothetical protein
MTGSLQDVFLAHLQVLLLKLFDIVKTFFFARGSKVLMGMESSEHESFSSETG